MKFTEMNLSDYIVKGLSAQGIENATEIQELTIPSIRSGSDIIGLSETGSGKTYAYGIPALERIDTEAAEVQLLVICPTRELAAQIADDLRKLTGFTSDIGILPILGGSNMERQIRSLKRGVNIVIGTPGRLMDHLRRKTLKLDSLRTVVLDEADEMLDMGFKLDIETILKSTPDTRQTVMFSATMPPEIIKLTKLFMRDPVMIKSKNHDGKHDLIKQFYVKCNKPEKTEILGKIYKELNPEISIVFCNTKRMTEELSRALEENGFPAVCLHGDMRQNERKRVMSNFKKSGGNGILVATDVAARGIDIKNVDIVINYDFPNNEDYYVHRIGRTGRAGKDGIAFTLLTTKQEAKDFHNLTGKDGDGAEEYASLSSTQWGSKTAGRSAAGNKFGAKRPNDSAGSESKRDRGSFSGGRRERTGGTDSSPREKSRFGTVRSDKREKTASETNNDFREKRRFGKGSGDAVPTGEKSDKPKKKYGAAGYFNKSAAAKNDSFDAGKSGDKRKKFGGADKPASGNKFYGSSFQTRDKSSGDKNASAFGNDKSKRPGGKFEPRGSVSGKKFQDRKPNGKFPAKKPIGGKRETGYKPE